MAAKITHVINIPVRIEIDHPDDVKVKVSIEGVSEPGPEPDPDPDPDPEPQPDGTVDPVAAGALGIEMRAQTFTVPGRLPYEGFGFSITKDDPYRGLAVDQRDAVDPLLFRDLRTNVVRLWHKTGDAGSTINAYGKSGIAGRLQANGVKYFLLGTTDYVPGNVERYASQLIADIKELRAAGIPINVAGVQNEPGSDDRADIPKSEMIPLYVALFTRNQEQGLGLRFLSPEYASGDSRPKDFWRAVKDHAVARGIEPAIHAYNMCWDRELSTMWEGLARPKWQTEAGEGSINSPDISKAWDLMAKAAARFANDLNQGVGFWVWFIGLGAGSDDIGQKLIKHAGGKDFRANSMYWAMKHIQQAVPYGTRFARISSNFSGNNDLVWTYGKKPPVNAAIGLRPDGRVVIVVANSSRGAGAEGGFGFWKATKCQPLILVDGLRSSSVFDIIRTGPGGTLRPDGARRLEGGKLRLTVNSTELVTAVSREPAL